MHTHSFVEIAFAVGGAATHHSQAGRREMQPGDVLLLFGQLGQSGFARRFKAHYGLSATDYRKRFATSAAHLDLPAEAAS